MASQQVPTYADCIPVVLSTIEQFLDLSESVQLSVSCKELRRAIIDEETEKIKVSHFELCRDTPAKGKSPHFILGALNSIHFPSLRHFHLDFSAVRDPWGRSDVDNAVQERIGTATLGFPLFVSHLAYAKNIESLFLDVDAAVRESPHLIDNSLFHAFGKNLARCKKMTELEVVNAYVETRVGDDYVQLCTDQCPNTSACENKGHTQVIQIFCGWRSNRIQCFTMGFVEG